MMTSNSLGKLCLLAASNVPDLIKEMLIEASCPEELGANDEKKKKRKRKRKAKIHTNTKTFEIISRARVGYKPYKVTLR